MSTRWLPHYLAWFGWAEQARRSGSRPARMLYGQAAAGRYGHTRAALFSMPQPSGGIGNSEVLCQRRSNTE